MERIRKLEEAHEGVFLPILNTLLIIGQGLEVVLEGIQFEGCEAFPGELVGLVGVSIATPWSAECPYQLLLQVFTCR